MPYALPQPSLPYSPSLPHSPILPSLQDAPWSTGVQFIAIRVVEFSKGGIKKYFCIGIKTLKKTIELVYGGLRI